MSEPSRSEKSLAHGWESLGIPQVPWHAQMLRICTSEIPMTLLGVRLSLWEEVTPFSWPPSTSQVLKLGVPSTTWQPWLPSNPSWPSCDPWVSWPLKRSASTTSFHHQFVGSLASVTPQKTNMSPENQWLEDVFPIEIVPLLGDMLVFRGVSRSKTFPPVKKFELRVLVPRQKSAEGIGWWGRIPSSLWTHSKETPREYHFSFLFYFVSFMGNVKITCLICWPLKKSLRIFTSAPERQDLPC